MDTLQAIFTRRSIRQYTGEPISDDELHTLLHAGFAAPSGMNTRPWRFLVIRKPETLQEITKVHPYSRMLPAAGCGILVCGDGTVNPDEGFLTMDGSAAIENILLAAHAMGLGAVWLGVVPHPERIAGLKALLGIPEEIKPIGLIAVGHPAEERPAPDRYEGEKVFHEQWPKK